MTRTCPATLLGHYDHPYRFGNSRQGIIYAVQQGLDWIDNDAQESKDHTLWCMHWGWLFKDGFYGVKGGPLFTRGRRRAKSLTDQQLSRVISNDGYNPRLYWRQSVDCARELINQEIELKCKASEKALTKLFRSLAEAQKIYPDFQIRVKILQGVLTKRQIIREFRRVKKVAEATGVSLDTLYLNHSNKPVKLNKKQREVVDLVRGKWVKV